jgi:tRNA uridine 5-carboxymethylaminomethyl modification enzyme
MGKVADASCIQFRQLNTRKGLAVRSSRAQVDIDAYPRIMQQHLRSVSGLTIIEAEATAIQISHGRISGLMLGDGRLLETPCVILTTGTFLSGVMHCGDEKTIGGRVGNGAAHQLATSLTELGVRLGRLKTGTVPRLDHDTIDWAGLEEQQDTVPEGRFSFSHVRRELPPITCHLAYTNAQVHQIVRDGLDRSPLFTGKIEGTGPRYCPSIEDKIVRFPQRDRHLLFLEPEGLNTNRVYVNGLSTSLPADIQDAMVHAIPGLEHAKILQYGYAVEYDFADARDLTHGLEHREVPGLFFAGQVNGTSGYEEAAVQGFIAGVSAATGQPLVLGRDKAYIGVLIDDLVSKGVGGEPYRMFTSRAEHRLILREDNADRRLMPRGRELGLVEDETWLAFESRAASIVNCNNLLDRILSPDRETLAQFAALDLALPRKPISLREVLRRPEVDWTMLQRLDTTLPDVDPAVAEQLEIDSKYAGYVARARRRAADAAKMEHVEIPVGTDWHAMIALSSEVRERLSAHQPTTLGQLGRLPGITPAAVNVVAAWLTSQAAKSRRSNQAARR